MLLNINKFYSSSRGGPGGPASTTEAKETRECLSHITRSATAGPDREVRGREEPPQPSLTAAPCQRRPSEQFDGRLQAEMKGARRRESFFFPLFLTLCCANTLLGCKTWRHLGSAGSRGAAPDTHTTLQPTFFPMRKRGNTSAHSPFAIFCGSLSSSRLI